MSHRVSAVGTLLALGALQGCSSSSATNSSAPAPADAGAGAGATDSGSTATGTLSILVVAISDGAPGVPPSSNAPIVGAQVSIDMPGGGQQTATSDANGKVTFTGIDWTLGSASILGTSTGYGAFGIADVNPTNFKSLPVATAVQGQADLVLALPVVAPSLATLTATLQNKGIAADYVFLSATLGSGVYNVNTGTASLPVATTAPYALVTEEFTNGGSGRDDAFIGGRWASYAVPQATGATQAIPLDLTAGGTTLTPITTHTHVVVPGGSTGPLSTSFVTVAVTSVESNYHVGLGQSLTTTISADGSAFDTVNEHVTLSGQTLVTEYELFTGSGDAAAVVLVDGAPQDNATISNFLMPPSLTVGQVSISQPIVFTAPDPTTVSFLSVTTAASTIDALLVVEVPPGVTTIHPPTLPGSLTANLTGAKGTISSKTDFDAALGRFSRIGVSRQFEVKP